MMTTIIDGKFIIGLTKHDLKFLKNGAIKLAMLGNLGEEKDPNKEPDPVYVAYGDDWTELYSHIETLVGRPW